MNLAGYRGLAPEFVHGFVNHAEQYVNGHVHTNGMENFWASLKRMIKGTYVSVEPFHLFRYLDEEAFRFNERKANRWRTFQGSRKFHFWQTVALQTTDWGKPDYDVTHANTEERKNDEVSRHPRSAGENAPRKIYRCCSSCDFRSKRGNRP